MFNLFNLAIFSSLCFSFILSFNYLTFDPNAEIDYNYPKPTLEGSLKKDLDFIGEVSRDGQLTACLVLARNNIVGHNINVTLAIKNTRFDKARVFDKIVVSMVKNCVKNFDEKRAEEVLSTENITLLQSPHESVLIFEMKDIESDPKFDEEELNLLNIIYKSGESTEDANNRNKTLIPEQSVTVQENLVANVMMELEKTQTRYLIVGLVISFVISFLIWQTYTYLSRKRHGQVIQIQNTKTSRVKKNR